jgi:hypothetical protein
MAKPNMQVDFAITGAELDFFIKEGAHKVRAAAF